MKRFLTAALLVLLSICLQAQDLKRGGYPLAEVTSQWTEQGYTIHEEYDDYSGTRCYYVMTEFADFYYYMDEYDELVTNTFVWPKDDDALKGFIDAYHYDYDYVEDGKWKLDVDGGTVYVSLLEDEGEYFFEITYILD